MRLKPLCLMLITDQAWQLEVVVIFTSVQLCNASLLMALRWALPVPSFVALPARHPSFTVPLPIMIHASMPPPDAPGVQLTVV